jgi:hypothetical protein
MLFFNNLDIYIYIYIYIYIERERERERERVVYLQVTYATCNSLSHIHTLYIIHGGRLSTDTCHNTL